MKKTFYDDLINFPEIEKLIKKSATTSEEKEELWKIVGEIVHHRVMGCILDNLEKEHHEEFLKRFANDPFDDEIIRFLEEKSGKKISGEIKVTVQKIETEILNDLK